VNAQDVRALLRDAPGPDDTARLAVEERTAVVIRPSGAFERLDRIVAWLAGWQATAHPTVEKPACIVFVGEHGVAYEQQVSAYPPSVTAAMLGALNKGIATAPVLAGELGASFVAVDAGVGRPTADLSRMRAMSQGDIDGAFALGRRAVADTQADLLVLGEMGIGNTTAAAAVCACLYGMMAEDWTGRGTGVDDATYARKVAVVEAARRRVQTTDPIAILGEVGGTELVAIAGAALQARLQSIPLVLDGFVSTAAVAPLAAVDPTALDHAVAGHVSPEPGHRLLLEKLGKVPLLDLGLRLGEGSGALLALPLIRLATVSVTEVATFGDLG
jgi:nicotinate-nucleotide--dimethylbenzimidazole phosphoribosyltransferase